MMLHSLNLLISYSINTPIRRFAFAITGGLIFACTLPFIGWGILAWFALIPLFLLIKSANSFRTAILEGFIFIFVYNLVSFLWLFGLHPLTWQGFSISESILITSLAWLAPSLFHSLVMLPFIGVVKLFYNFRTDHRTNELQVIDIFLLALLWVVLQHKLLLNFGGVFSVPINFLVYSQYENKALIQVCNIIGAIGLEYFIVLVNLAGSNLFNVQRSQHDLGRHIKTSSNLNIKQPFFGVQKTNEHFNIFVILFSTFIVIFIYGLVQINCNKRFDKKHAKTAKSFAIVQADYSAAATRSNKSKPENLFALQYKISTKIIEPKDLLIWSEGAVPILDKSNVLADLKTLAQYTSVFVYGTYTQNKQGKIFNSIEYKDYSYEPEKTYRYHKRNLVPFGEYTPFYSVLPGFLKMLANSTVGEGFNRGSAKQDIVRTSNANIASALCFELLFPELIRSYVIKGAEVIVNLNDLSWFKGQSFIKDWVKKQFLAVAVFRAVENNRDLLLAGNSGYSALITSYGEIMYKSDANKIAMIQGTFVPRKNYSNYSLYGW
jgi:apolipoprotein N-acyltransferase